MAYITKEEVLEIRKELKNQFPKFKFSCKKASGGLAVHVSLKAGPVDLYDGSLDTLGYNNETIKFNGYYQVNQYHLYHCGKHEPMFEKIINIIKTAPAKAPNGRAWFDKSDIQTDYFHTAFYFNVHVGEWNTPYKVIKG